MEPRSGVKVAVGYRLFGLLLFGGSIFLCQRGRYFAAQHPLRTGFTSVVGLHGGPAVRLGGAVTVGRVTGSGSARRAEGPGGVQCGGDLSRTSARTRAPGWRQWGSWATSSWRSASQPGGAAGRGRHDVGRRGPIDVAALVGQGRRLLGMPKPHRRARAGTGRCVADQRSREQRLLAETLGSVRPVTPRWSTARGGGWLLRGPGQSPASAARGAHGRGARDSGADVRRGPGLAHALIYDPEGGRLPEGLADPSRRRTPLLDAIRPTPTADSRAALRSRIETPGGSTCRSCPRTLRTSAGSSRAGRGTLEHCSPTPTIYDDLAALLEGAERSSARPLGDPPHDQLGAAGPEGKRGRKQRSESTMAARRSLVSAPEPFSSGGHFTHPGEAGSGLSQSGLGVAVILKSTLEPLPIHRRRCTVVAAEAGDRSQRRPSPRAVVDGGRGLATDMILPRALQGGRSAISVVEGPHWSLTRAPRAALATTKAVGGSDSVETTVVLTGGYRVPTGPTNRQPGTARPGSRLKHGLLSPRKARTFSPGDVYLRLSTRGSPDRRGRGGGRLAVVVTACLGRRTAAAAGPGRISLSGFTQRSARRDTASRAPRRSHSAPRFLLARRSTPSSAAEAQRQGPPGLRRLRSCPSLTSRRGVVTTAGGRGTLASVLPLPTTASTSWPARRRRAECSGAGRGLAVARRARAGPRERRSRRWARPRRCCRPPTQTAVTPRRARPPPRPLRSGLPRVSRR